MIHVQVIDLKQRNPEFRYFAVVSFNHRQQPEMLPSLWQSVLGEIHGWCNRAYEPGTWTTDTSSGFRFKELTQASLFFMTWHRVDYTVAIETDK